MSAPTSRYRLVRTIASGGMAHVYEAHAVGERGFLRRVAIKRILPQHANDERMRRMFFDEASIASRLHHANIVQVLDFGVLEDDDFLVMEFVDGLDAARATELAISARATLPEALALHMISEVAHALAYAHALSDDSGEPLGIVHRDVSPHNLLLSWDGDVKLADFGIALARGREHRTIAGEVKGKLLYMPPEQADGRELTAAVDVYALGATLHALLTGAPPREHPRTPLVLDGSLSDSVVALVRACTSDDPADRPSAEQLAERAGRLAHAGLERDARGALRVWLATLREAPKRSALDDLMGMVLIASENGRRFTLSRSAPEEPDAAGGSEPPEARAASSDAPLASELSIHLPMQRRGPLWAALALSVLALAGGAVFLAAGEDAAPDAEPVAASESGSESGSATTASDATTTAHAPSGSELALDASHVSDPSTAPAPPNAPSRPPSGTRPRRPPETDARSVPPETSDPRPPSLPPEVEPAAATTDAYLRIPRVGANAERIRIDGAARGFTPAVVRVAPGVHRVVLEEAETGDVVLEREVRAGAQHTRLAPLVVAH